MILSYSFPKLLARIIPLSFEHFPFSPLSPLGWRGIVIMVRTSGRAGSCQICGTHISLTTRLIFCVQRSVELSRSVVVHCHDHLPICPIWACPWAKNFSNLPKIKSRLCERISLKPLDGFMPFKVSWTCLEL